MHAFGSRNAVSALLMSFAAWSSTAQGATFPDVATVSVSNEAGTVTAVNNTSNQGETLQFYAIPTTLGGVATAKPVFGHPTPDGSLTFEAATITMFGTDVFFGDFVYRVGVKEYVTHSHVSTGGQLVNDLVQPGNTSFSFHVSGRSDDAASQVSANLELTAADGSTFAQTATSSGQGNWSLPMAAPLGFNVATWHLKLSAVAANHLDAVTIRANLGAVPEPASAAFLGLGLSLMMGRFATRRRH